jgi:hypothetical protein
MMSLGGLHIDVFPCTCSCVAKVSQTGNGPGLNVDEPGEAASNPAQAI